MEMPIRIYSPFLDWLVEIDRYISLQFPVNFYGIGEFELNINRYAHGVDSLEEGNIVKLGEQDNKAGIIQSKEIALDQDGKVTENWKITGYTLDGIISRRITLPGSDDNENGGGYDRKSGDAETVIKHYINKHFVNPEDTQRKINQLEIAENKNRGLHVDWQSRLKIVSDDIENIGKMSGLGWIVKVDTTRKKFIFDVIESVNAIKGNEEGNTPVVFSPEFGTIKEQTFSNSVKDYKNVGYVGGQGEGENRKIITVGDEVLGIDRIETFIDAKNVGSDEATEKEIIEQLNKQGEQKLSEKSRLLSFEAKILTPVTSEINRNPDGKPVVKTPFEYEVDFGIGYRVTILNQSWGVVLTAPIVEMLEVHEDGGFILEATFGESKPTIISEIDKKFKDISGIEEQEFPAKYSQLQLQRAIDYTNQEVLQEQKDRIDMADKKLNESREYTEEYAEEKFHEGIIPPDDISKRWLDTSNVDDGIVVWKTFNDATQEWLPGPSGPQGVPGPKGEDGQSLYTWVKYADDENGLNISDNPANKTYIGLAYNNTMIIESNDPILYTWAKIEGPQGDQGIEGPSGKDGKPRYTWIKYADDAFGIGLTDSPDGKAYLGLSYNNLDQTESNDPTVYTYSKIEGPQGPQGDQGPQGLRGLQGNQGEQGIQGPIGEDGKSSYTHIAYATDSTGATGFSVSDPVNKTYIGLYVDNNSIDSQDNMMYKWSLIKGAKGDQGIQGAIGENGETPYFHIAYANNVDGTSGFSTSDSINKTHIGQYTDYIQVDSNVPSDYSWSEIKGEKGDQGVQGDQGIRGLRGVQGPIGDQGIQGPQGENGVSSYTHIAYANNADGTSGFSVSDSTNKKYIGIYVDEIIADPDNPILYNWTLIKGSDGEQGIQGPIGDNGRTPFLHIAYSNDSTGSTNFSVSDSTNKTYIGTYTDYISGDSIDNTLYDWSKIQGPQGNTGDKGAIGPQGPQGETGPKGLQGIQGPQGDIGIRGPQGVDGQDSYAHIAYATNSVGTSGFSTSDSSGKTYIGLYVDSNSLDSNDYSKYNWSLIKGADGSQGIQGNTGDDGNTSYLHIAYANNSTGSSGFSVTDSAGKDYIGQYTDFTLNDSADYNQYSWTLIKGAKGDTGVTGPKGDKGDQGVRGLQGIQGPKGDQGIRGVTGSDGQTSYTHVAYANNSTGTSGFSVSDSSGKTYIGVYVDFSSTDSADNTRYAWTLIKGAQGDQGIRGPVGSDGRTSYFHTAYANNSTGSSGFSTTDSTNREYIGTYTDFSSADSGSYTRYKWTKIIGPQGPQGDKGNQGPEGDRGPQGPNIVDSTTEIVANVIKANNIASNQIKANHINSLNGLNVGNGQFVVDAYGNVEFSGELKGATGTFSGEIQSRRLVIDNPNVEMDGVVGLQLQVAVPYVPPTSTKKFMEVGHIDFDTSGGGLELRTIRSSDGAAIPMDYFDVHTSFMNIYGTLDCGYEGGLQTARIMNSPNAASEHIYLMAADGNSPNAEIRVTSKFFGGGTFEYAPLRAGVIFSESRDIDLGGSGRLFNDASGITFIQANGEVRATRYQSNTLVPLRARELVADGGGSEAVLTQGIAHGATIFRRDPDGNSDYIAYLDGPNQPGVYYFCGDAAEVGVGGNPYSSATALLYAGEYNFGSQRERKVDVKKLQASALHGVKKSPVYDFVYEKHAKIKSKNIDNPHRMKGLMYEEIPEELKSVDKSISLNSTVAYLWKALQEENEEHEQLKEEVSELKSTVSGLIKRIETLENAK